MGTVYFVLCLVVATLLSWRGGKALHNHTPLGGRGIIDSALDQTSTRTYSIFLFFFFFTVPLIWVFTYSVGGHNYQEDWCSQKTVKIRSSDYCKDTEYYIDSSINPFLPTTTEP
jgi:hypothetical protein